jgi:hypothetical protein
MLHFDPREIATGVRGGAINIRVGREDRDADDLFTFPQFLLGRVV